LRSRQRAEPSLPMNNLLYKSSNAAKLWPVAEL
jgi:hypothetical protein